MILKRHTKVRLKRALRHMTPRHVTRTHLTRRAIDRFAEKIGLVYFGTVDQKDDDHRIVRGSTASSTHLDSHYCIGTFQGYDIVLLLRNDTVKLRNLKERRYHWLVYTIDLHAAKDTPHFYIGHHNHKDAYDASFAQLKPVLLGHLAPYPSQFVSHYTVYSQAAHSLEVEQIITPSIAEVIATHFQGVSIEVDDGTIYMYVESEHPREALLEKVLSNGIWLAEQMDSRAVSLRTAERP